jgi:hypothetical protein
MHTRLETFTDLTFGTYKSPMRAALLIAVREGSDSTLAGMSIPESCIQDDKTDQRARRLLQNTIIRNTLQSCKATQAKEFNHSLFKY